MKVVAARRALFVGETIAVVVDAVADSVRARVGGRVDVVAVRVVEDVAIPVSRMR